MTNVLSNSASFTTTNLAVQPYNFVNDTLNPNGSVITNNIDGRIMNAAVRNNSLVAAHTVGVGANEDDAQWYRVDLSTGTPTLAEQGRVGFGANTYTAYPGIDINPTGQLGMSVTKSGTNTPTDFMSMYVAVKLPTDPAGKFGAPILVSAGTGQANYFDFAGGGSTGGRQGDLSGISIDPVDGTFWAVNEYATNNSSGANWGTAVANFAYVDLLEPPQNVVAVAKNPYQADVTWSIVKGADLGYEIYLVIGTTKTLVGTATQPGSGTTVSAVAGALPPGSPGLIPGTSNKLFVRAKSSTYTPSFADSSIVSVTTPLPLGTATNVTAQALSPTSVKVQWNAALGATGYQIFRQQPGGDIPVSGILPANPTNVTLTGLPSGTTMKLYVKALNVNLYPYATSSTTATVTTPFVVTSPQLTAKVTSLTTATLTWSASQNAAGYRIYERIGNQVFLVGIVGPSVLSYKVTGLPRGQSVQFMVQAFNNYVSADSNWVTVNGQSA
ncbi:MAG: fibronectin type III domain-containing protein [Planctomycetes bacterium]|nr:fibronectin type III domain-containing protein [Planctomycetota bacterium]